MLGEVESEQFRCRTADKGERSLFEGGRAVPFFESRTIDENRTPDDLHPSLATCGKGKARLFAPIEAPGEKEDILMQRHRPLAPVG
jgi:hypothetical protein